MNTKLLPALRSLNQAEQARFEAFLHSPYHNTRTHSLRCWDFFRAFSPDFADQGISIPALGAHLFPEKKASRQAILDEISHLYRLLKAFWEVEGLRANTLLQRSLRLQQLSERRLDRLYAIERKAATKLLESTSLEREQYYEYELEWATIDNEQFGRRQLRTFDESLAHKLRALDVYFLILSLRESCEALNRQHILNTTYEFPLLSALIDVLAAPDHPYRNVPLIEGYYQIYLSLHPMASEEDYHRLLASLRNHRQHFSKAEGRAMYKYAQNFCIRKINEGRSDFEQHLFELFQELLKEGIIFSQDILSHTDCKNIVTIGLRVKAIAWVEHFLETYRHQVDEAFRDNVLAYCRAALAAEKGHTQRAIRLLQSISHTDVHYQISARQLLLKIYFYKEDLEAVLYTIDAFRHFLQRNRELPKARKAYHLRFLNLFKRLCLLREKWPTYSSEEAQQRLQKLQRKLDDSEALANRAWLQEELAAIR